MESYTGIWFSEAANQYFVGKKDGYEHKQEKGFPMRRIIPHSGTFDPDRMFPLMHVDFIRFKGYTVYPYPFKLIDMKIASEEEGQVVGVLNEGMIPRN